MSLAEKLTKAAENVKKVYDAGYSLGYDDGEKEGYADGTTNGKAAQTKALWYAIQDGDKRRCYTEAFRNKSGSAKVWDDNTFAPIYDIISGPCSADYLFYRCNMTSIDVLVDLRNTTSAYAVFARCGKLKTAYVFLPYYVPLEKGFLGCVNLKDLTIYDEIRQSGLDVSDCPLTRKSLMSILNALRDYGNEEKHFLTLGSRNLSMLSTVHIADATQKGWTLT